MLKAQTSRILMQIMLVGNALFHLGLPLVRVCFLLARGALLQHGQRVELIAGVYYHVVLILLQHGQKTKVKPLMVTREWYLAATFLH